MEMVDSQKSVGRPDESVWQMVWHGQQTWAQPNIETDQEELLCRVNAKRGKLKRFYLGFV